MTNATGQGVSRRLSDLEKDVSQQASVIERHYVTLEKLTEVSTAISQLLAVQGNRLDFQEKVADQLQDLVEKRRTETEVYVKDLYSKIDTVETELEQKMTSQQESIINEIKSLSEASSTQHDTMNKRMNSFERWMWVLIGGGGVIMLLIQSAEFFKNILS